MKRILALLLCLVMVCSLAACGSGSSSGSGSAAAEATTQTTGTDSTAVTIGYVTTHYPAYPSSANYDDFIIQGMVYDKLFDVDDETGEYVARLLESYEWTDDVTLHMVLKDGIYFNDGKQMTMEDVLFSMQNYIIQGETTDKNEYYSRIDFDKCVISDDGMELDLVYAAPYGPALRTLNFSVMEKEFTEAHPDTDEVWYNSPVGSGPYEITDCVKGSYVVFTLREDYWDTSRTFDATEITLKFYTDESAMYMDYQAGNIDVAYGITATTVASIQAANGAQGSVTLVPDNDILYLHLNEDDEILSNPLVREAIAHAIDYEYLTEVAYGVMGTPATSHFASGFDAYVEHEQYTYDPELSMQLLEQAGYKAGDITLSWISPDMAPEPLIGETVQAFLAQIGITVNVQSYQLATALGYHLSGETDISDSHTMGGNPVKEPDNALSSFYENGAFTAFSISEPEYNEYYYAGLNNVEEDARWEAYKKLDAWLWDNYLAIPVCEINSAIAYNSRIASFPASAIGRSCLGSLKLA
ncbi:MAG: ABC transporter substrate-binding protein [Oscillospiraceae bacterium]